MESSNLDFQAASATNFVPEVRPSSSSREISGEQEPTPSATSGWSRLYLPWRRVNDQDSDVLRVGLKTEGPGGGLPKHVSFAEGLEEDSGAERVVESNRDHAVRRSDRDLRERIARLEEKRDGLGVHEHKRITDLNDIIDYLQDRLKPDATYTGARDTTTLHDERQPEPMRSDSNRGPAIIYEEVIPKPSFVDRFSKSSIAPPPPSQRLDNVDDIFVTNSYPQGTYEDLEIVEDSSRPGRTYYESGYGARNNSRNGPRKRRGSRRDEEDIIVRRDGEDVIAASRDHDRSSQEGWPEWSKSGHRPSRQESFDTRGGPIIVRDIIDTRKRDRSWERTTSQSVQPSRQLSQETDYYDDLERRRVENDGIVIRRDGISKPTPRDRQYFPSSGSEYSVNGSRIPWREPSAGKPGQSQALVLRAGAYRPPYDYVRERVLNGGIRVRGENPEPAVSQHVRRLSRPPTSRRNSYRDRSWAPSLRRKFSETWHGFDSSEDEDSGYPRMKNNDGGNDNPEAELSDADVIAQTLKQFTTTGDSDMPTTGISAPPARTKSASEMAVGRSALRNAPYALSGPERKRSLPVPGRNAHFEEENDRPQTIQNGRATNEISNSMDEKPFLDRISEEPGVMNEDSNILHHQRDGYFPQRPILPHPQQNSPFPSPPDLASYSREVSPRAQSRDSDLVIDEVQSTQGEQPYHARQEEGDDEVEVIRTISRNPTVREEVD